MYWFIGAAAAVALMIAVMYRRSDNEIRVRGMLFTLGWLALVAPAAYFRFDRDLRAAALSAVLGVGFFAALSRMRFDHRKGGRQLVT